MVMVERDYTQLFDKFTSLGDNVRNGVGAHGISFDCNDFYDQIDVRYTAGKYYR